MPDSALFSRALPVSVTLVLNSPPAVGSPPEALTLDALSAVAALRLWTSDVLMGEPLAEVPEIPVSLGWGLGAGVAAACGLGVGVAAAACGLGVGVAAGVTLGVGVTAGVEAGVEVAGVGVAPRLVSLILFLFLC